MRWHVLICRKRFVRNPVEVYQSDIKPPVGWAFRMWLYDVLKRFIQLTVALYCKFAGGYLRRSVNDASILRSAVLRPYNLNFLHPNAVASKSRMRLFKLWTWLSCTSSKKHFSASSCDTKHWNVSCKAVLDWICKEWSWKPPQQFSSVIKDTVNFLPYTLIVLYLWVYPYTLIVYQVHVNGQVPVISGLERTKAMLEKYQELILLYVRYRFC